MDKVEVVVVGAGLAGLAAALVLAENGVEVLVVERGDYPGSKNVSGGRLYLEPVRPYLPSDLWDDAPFERHVVKERLTVTSADGGVTLEVTGDKFKESLHSVTVLRATFDQWLAEQATARGALVVPGYRVDDLLRDGDRVIGIRAAGADIHADVVVLAEGILGLVAQGAGLRPEIDPRDFAVGVKEIIELPADRIQERFGLVDGEGAAQLFLGSVSDGMVGGGFLYTNKESVSLGLVIGSHELAKRSARNDGNGATTSVPHELMEEFKARPEVAPLIKGGNSVEYSAHGVLEGGGRRLRRLYGDGILLAGDCAGLAQNLGITVRGMDFALASGAMAGQAVLRAREQQSYSAAGLAVYEDLLRDSFVMKDLETFKHMPEFLENPRVFSLYPDLACDVLTELFWFGKAPKQPLVSSTIRTAWRRLPLMAALRDALAARKV